MGVNKLISIKQPILEALGDMGIDHGKNIVDLTRWAVRAEKMIGSYYSYKKLIKVLTVDKYRAELPCEAIAVQRVLLGDYGCDVYDLFNQTVTVQKALSLTNESTFLVIDAEPGNTNIEVGFIKWEIQDNHIILNADYDAQKLTIQYLGLETDEDGFPKVIEGHQEAIIEYIMYRYAKRSRFGPGPKMDFQEVEMFKREWSNLCADARAEDARLSESEHMEIVSMISDPLIGYGLEVGMSNRFDY